MKRTIIYLNCVLTVIAVALTVIVLQNAEILPKAYAASGLYTLPINEKGEMPVRIMNGDMDVNVNNTVDVNIESSSRNAFYNAEPIEVKVRE